MFSVSPNILKVRNESFHKNESKKNLQSSQGESVYLRVNTFNFQGHSRIKRS